MESVAIKSESGKNHSMELFRREVCPGHQNRRYGANLMKMSLGLVILHYGLASLVFSGDKNWGKWGEDDQIGTLNYITSDVVQYAATLAKTGKVFNLALPVEPESPSGGPRYGRINRYMVTIGKGDGQYEDPGLAEDHLFVPVHGPTHWDGLAHIFGDGKLYNGYEAKTHVTWRGALKDGIHHAASKIVTRGVLIDIARYKEVKWLESGCAVTPQDIEKAAERQGVSFRSGDAILIRTGYISRWHDEGRAAFYDGSPGIGWETSQWLKQIQAAVVAVDNMEVEVVPAEAGSAAKIGQSWGMPIHYELLRNQGMMIGDWFWLDELAEDCARDGVYEFLFAAPPLNILNGSGSPANPLAIK